MRRIGVVVGNVFGDLWDLGSIPRSPHNSMLFFSIHSCAGFQMVSTMCPHRSARHVSIDADPKVKKGSTLYSWSTSTPLNPEGQQALCKWASNSNHTLQSGPKPPLGLQFLFCHLYFICLIFIFPFY